jgi:hypothetical protein
VKRQRISITRPLGLAVAERDPVADLDGAIDLQRQPAHHVAERVLEREADDRGQHRAGGDEALDRQAGLLPDPDHRDAERDRREDVDEDAGQVDPDQRRDQAEGQEQGQLHRRQQREGLRCREGPARVPAGGDLGRVGHQQHDVEAVEHRGQARARAAGHRHPPRRRGHQQQGAEDVQRPQGRRGLPQGIEEHGEHDGPQGNKLRARAPATPGRVARFVDPRPGPDQRCRRQAR